MKIFSATLPPATRQSQGTSAPGTVPIAPDIDSIINALIEIRANVPELPADITGLAEYVQDTIGAALSGTGVISVTYNDAANTLTISSAATTNSTDATLLARANHTGTQAQSTVVNLTTDLAAKAPLASPTFTGTVSGITKAMVGLPLADNTSDASKPISTATQSALNQKADTSALDSTPVQVMHNGTAYPSRPITSRPVWWIGPEGSPPDTTGTTTSGTGAVQNLDMYVAY